MFFCSPLPNGICLLKKQTEVMMALISLYFLNIFYNIIVLFYDYKNINVADDMVNYYDKTFIIWNVP